MKVVDQFFENFRNFIHNFKNLVKVRALYGFEEHMDGLIPDMHFIVPESLQDQIIKLKVLCTSHESSRKTVRDQLKTISPGDPSDYSVSQIWWFNYAHKILQKVDKNSVVFGLFCNFNVSVSFDVLEEKINELFLHFFWHLFVFLWILFDFWCNGLDQGSLKHEWVLFWKENVFKLELTVLRRKQLFIYHIGIGTIFERNPDEVVLLCQEYADKNERMLDCILGCELWVLVEIKILDVAFVCILLGDNLEILVSEFPDFVVSGLPSDWYCEWILFPLDFALHWAVDGQNFKKYYNVR